MSRGCELLFQAHLTFLVVVISPLLPSCRYKPVRTIVNHRPVPVPVAVPHRVLNPVPIYRPVVNTILNPVPVPVRVQKPVPVATPVDVPKAVPFYQPVDVVKPVPVEDHHLVIRKIGVPVSATAARFGHFTAEKTRILRCRQVQIL